MEKDYLREIEREYMRLEFPQNKIRIVFRRGYYDLVVPANFDWSPANALLALQCRVWCERENRRRYWSN